MTAHNVRIMLALLLSFVAGCSDPAVTDRADTGAGPAATADTVASTKADAATPDDANARTADTGLPAVPFKCSIVLGSPTTTSLQVRLMPTEVGGSLTVRYGTQPGIYDQQSPTVAGTVGAPAALAIGGLSPDTRYYYRVILLGPNGVGVASTDEHTFHTARPAGRTFVFTVQADSHLDENSVLAVYHRTLANIAMDNADFHVDLGDTFFCNKHTKPLDATVKAASDLETVIARYAYEMTNFSIATHSTALFLTNGNHEGEAGVELDGTPDNLAIWATLARKAFFCNPTPDGFYTGDTSEQLFVGKRAAWYAWTWGDALFVVLDPYWYSTSIGGQDPWGHTLGEAQYKWLEATLAANSAAKFKFIFIHNLVGGLDGQMRGGAEAAAFYEWGGKSEDGSVGFAAKRPGWAMPIHQLLVKYGVSAVFHGHDHLYAKQDLDGIVYMEVPQPSSKSSVSGPGLAQKFHYQTGTILSSSGYLRVTVTPSKVTGQYVRTWLPEATTAKQTNGQVDDQWEVAAK